MLRFLGKWEGGGGERERERKKNSAKKGEKTFFPCLCGSNKSSEHKPINI